MAEAKKEVNSPVAKQADPFDTIMAHFKRAFDWMDELVDDESKAVLMERVFEFLEDKLIDAYDVRLIPDGIPESLPQGFNLNAIIRDVGSSKRMRMDEADSLRRQERQGISPQERVENTATARDVAQFVIDRAVIQSDFVRKTLVDALTVGLNILVPDPTTWQKGRSE